MEISEDGVIGDVGRRCPLRQEVCVSRNRQKGQGNEAAETTVWATGRKQGSSVLLLN